MDLDSRLTGQHQYEGVYYCASYLFIYYLCPTDCRTCDLIVVRVTWLSYVWPDCRTCDLIVVRVTWLSYVWPDCRTCDLIVVHVTWLSYVWPDYRLLRSTSDTIQLTGDDEADANIIAFLKARQTILSHSK